MTGHTNDDFLTFSADDGHHAKAADHDSRHWRVLVVDDEADVHAVTKLALFNLQVQNRPLEFLDAHSAAEARQILAREQNIAVILLDVVMEHERAGFDLIKFIREELHNHEVRIILRTGQPGYAPELEAIRDYDINDYKAKSELTRTRLYTSITSAIRAYEQICTVSASRNGLELIVRGSAELMALHGLQNFAAGIITQIAGMLGIAPEGLVCVEESKSDSTDKLMIVASAGRFSANINQPLLTIKDSRISDALLRSISDRKNYFEQTYTTLYFPGNRSGDMAAFIDTQAPLGEIERQLLEVFCANIAVGLQNVSLIEKLRNLAYYDQLVNLPNRTHFAGMIEERINSALQAQSVVALVDIDHFAETNNALGHHFGDLLLNAVAKRLQDGLPRECLIARIGGDTFGVLGLEDQLIPEKLLEQFHQPLVIADQMLQIAVTMGLVKLTETTAGNALKDANIALNHAKLTQRGWYFYFTRQMGVEIRERVQLMHNLRSDLDTEKLFLAYQPQIDLQSGKPCGVEALLRWRTDDGKLVPPDRFIPIAEYSGLIIELGAWVMRSALREQARLQQLGFDTLRVSVNVSISQFRHPDFIGMLAGALRDTGARAENIELEITESVAMEEYTTMINVLAQIRALGLKIAVDDFGTGFSSLSYLQQLQVDRLKIDRSFVREITTSVRGSRIAEMVVQLGRNLNLRVIAEGVEEEKQAEILKEVGCHEAQGWLYAQAMLPDELVGWLNSYTPK